MGRLAGKVAVVTGAFKGIAASIAEHLAAEGATVAVNFSNSVVTRIADKDGKAVAVQADVSKEADIARLFAETQSHYGSLDVLVNGRGRSHRGAL